MLASNIMLVVTLSISIAVAGCYSGAPDEYEHQIPYRGIPLEGEAFLCRSNHVASAGFYGSIHTPAEASQAVGLSEESAVSTWTIKVAGDEAHVVRFSGATGIMEDPETFAVEARNEYLLLWQGPSTKDGPQIITISLTDGSFVYSSHAAMPFLRWHRANIFYGSCERQLTGASS